MKTPIQSLIANQDDSVFDGYLMAFDSKNKKTLIQPPIEDPGDSVFDGYLTGI
jgi:hypothetical protein